MNSTQDDSPDQVRKVAEIAKDMRFAMLTTIDEQGTLVARPMAHQEVEFDGDLWFVAERASRKVRHITADPHVGVTMSSSDSWLSMDGTAELITDPAKAKELWNAGVAAWMPQGPEDPSVVLIKVAVATAQYWDTPGGRIASVFSFIKARVTGHRYEGGEEGVVHLPE
ncbi:pyridoxamine 5'-phosphate oxidase [Nakamurella sp. YIM 132087]|uniref:Pyridoxamine 5'-phosphate oxidase n=1 Tax=Nakamurella alba TaxID=2665158 RepID=A0A7K1FNZ3_9ACTN|nr:pyridoxamine 5'-phosphate oxidase family protein [Nakamurella alba]MTD14953.1 pyridoxamine 5'-phosphate oxidase [Nakamurella alba]